MQGLGDSVACVGLLLLNSLLTYTCWLQLQVVEEGYEFFAKRQLVTIFSAPNYCGEFENAGAMMSVDETLMCSFQVRRLLDLGSASVCSGVDQLQLLRAGIVA